MKLVNILNANNNEIQNFKVHQTASDISGQIGAMFVNTTSTNRLKINLAGTIRNIHTDADGVPTLVRTVTAGLIPITGAGGTIDAAYIPALSYLSSSTTLNTVPTATADVALGGFKITGLGTPTASTDAATKGYVDTAVQGLDAKASVKATTNAQVTLSGTQTVDGQTLTGTGVDGSDRILVRGQTLPKENGVYWYNSGGAWARCSDMDSWAEIPSAYVWVEQGTTFKDTGWVCTADVGGTLGTTDITWTQFNSAGGTSVGLNVGSVDSAGVSATIFTTMNGNQIQLRSIKQNATTPRISVNVTGSDVILDLASVTGTGNTVAMSAGPTFTGSPALSTATATSINGLTISTTTGTFTLTNLKTLAVTNSLTLSGTDAAVITFQGTDTYIGRATTDTLTNKTINFAVGGNVLQINSNTISSNTGSGSVNVLQNTPTLITPVLGVATGTSWNKVVITPVATAATLTILDGKTFTVNNTLTLAGTDTAVITFQGTDTYVGRATTDTLTNKTFNTANNTFSINGNAVSTSVPVLAGGTGATTAAAARQNLNAAGGFSLPSRYAADNGTPNPWIITQATHLCGATGNFQDITVYLYEKSTGTQVFADVTVASNGDISIAISPAGALTASTYRAVVIG